MPGKIVSGMLSPLACQPMLRTHRCLASGRLKSNPHWSEALPIGSQTNITEFKDQLGYSNKGRK